MVIQTCITLALVFVIFPLGIGNAWVRSKSYLLTMIGGLFFSFCIFEILAIVFHATLGSLRLMTLLWCGICFGISVWGWYGYYKGKRPQKAQTERWTHKQKIVLFIEVVLIMLQTLNTAINTYYGNWDDETYCGTAVTSWYTDTVDRYGPNSGVLQPAFYNQKYNIASWPVYSAMLAVLTGIHPAVIFRTILPLFEIPMAYFIAYLLLRCFLARERGKALLGLVYYQLLTLLTAENMPQTSGEWWLVVNCWTGKALTAAIMTPLILWVLIQLERSKDDYEKQKEFWKILLVVSWASCFISASLFFVVPMELAIWGGLYLLRTKRWTESFRFIVCGGPTALCAILTFF